MPASTAHVASSSEGPQGFCLLGEMETAREKATNFNFPFFSLFLKGAKAQILCLQPPTLGLGKGKAAQNGVVRGQSGMGGTGEGWGGAAVGISVLGYTSTP